MAEEVMYFQLIDSSLALGLYFILNLILKFFQLNKR